MKVMKFGGTSVGSPERMKDVAALINGTDDTKFVVLSAMSGTTNKLLQISECLYKKNPEEAERIIEELENIYMKHIETLFSTNEWREKTRLFLVDVFTLLKSFTDNLFTSFEEKNIVAQGEIISTNLFFNYLKEQNINAVLLNSLDFMRTDKNADPDIAFIKERLRDVISENKGYKIYIAQGFICRNAYGEIDNLLRGGSDYTASIIGSVLPAEEIQIWTDIDGMHNNDPRIVKNTEPVRQLNFEEAAELAYFGAKILHPTCILPAKNADIPVRLKNTMKPEAEGTIINNVVVKGKIKAIAAKDGITAIKIKSSRMLLATGFLHRIFETFESYQTSVDMVCTSEVSVSVSIEDKKYLSEITEELSKYGTVTIDEDMCIVCVVGDLDWTNVGFETLAAEAIKDVPVRMISYGGSNHNISFLIKAEDKECVLQNLSNVFFAKNK